MNDLRTLLIFCLLLSLSAVAPTAQAQSLSDATLLMLKQDPSLRSSEQDSRTAYQEWKFRRGGLLPEVTLNGSSGAAQRDRSTDGLVTQSGDTLFSNRIGLSVRQLLYDGGLTVNEARSSSSAYDSQRYLQMGQIEARVVDLSEVYLEIIRVRKQLEAARQNVSIHREIRDKLRESEGGSGTRADTSLIDGRLSLAKDTMFTQELALENAISRFVRLTGQEPGKLKTPAMPSVNGSLEGADVSGNWDYKAALSAQEAAQFKYRAKKGVDAPNVYLDAGASRGEDTLGVRGTDNEARALVVVSWDLYRGGRNKAEKERELIQLEKADELVREAEQQWTYQMRQLYSERRGSNASSESLKRYVAKLSQVASDYDQQFGIGDQELLDILDVRNEQYQAKSRLIDAQFNDQVSSFRISGLQGELVKHLIGDQIKEFVTVGEAEADSWYPDSMKQKKADSPSKASQKTASRPAIRAVPAESAGKKSPKKATPLFQPNFRLKDLFKSKQ